MPAKRSDSRTDGKGASTYQADEDRVSSRGRRSALIQLKFGRAAHLLSTITAVLLAVAAAIAFMITNWDYLINNRQPWLEATTQYIPLITAAFMAIVIIYLKWDPFMTDRTSKHFVFSFIALAVPLLMIVLIILKELRYADIGSDSWIYPASFIGISLSLISIAMIWNGMSRRKTIAIVAAVVPLAIMSLTLVANATGIFDILPLIYLSSAVCIQLSGSMMHVMSTSTSVQEREILKASDAKLIALKEDAERKQRELAFKEKAMMDREIGFETFDRTLNDLKLDLDQRKRQTEAQEKDLGERDQKFREEKQKFSSALLGISSREEKLQQKELELNSKEREQEAITLALQQKEEQLRQQADELQQDQTNLKVAEKQFKERQELIQEEMASLKASREALMAEQRQQSEKMRDLQLKESSLDMRIRSAESSKAPPAAEVERLRQWEEKLLKKEEKLATAEAEIVNRAREPEQLLKQAELKIASADERLKAIEAKEREVLERESSVLRFEKDIMAGREDLQQKITEIDKLRGEAESRKTKYDSMIERIGKRAEEIAKREELIQTGSTSMEGRERSIRASLERLEKEKQEMEAQRRALIELEKSVDARNAQLQTREIGLRDRQREIDVMLQSGGFTSEATGTMMEEVKQREHALELREKMLADKERELRKKAYVSTKAVAGEEEEEIAEKPAAGQPEKIGTGTKRLDDLLLGGFPHGSSILFVGPPYSGKEVGILAFLAEGFKRDIPAVIIATSKSPSDLVKDFAPIMPSILEVERLGLVRWVDATAGEAQKGEEARQRRNVIKVAGPDDFPGIIEAIEKLTEDVRKGRYPFFKLGYLSLSTSISHTDEMESTKFIQAIARSIRDLGSSAVFALEKGMHSEQQIESIQHLMDGALMIKLDKQKTFMSVLGIGEVQTRDWVEFKHTNAGLIIGAFSLERIR